MKTHIVSILDRSGSMSGKEKDVIGTFNSFVKEQQKNKDLDINNTTFTLILFDNTVEVIHNQIPLRRVESISSKTYYTRGSTSLLDALGYAMRLFKKKDKVLVLVETDGEENSSREFSSETIQKMVGERKERKWDFIFTSAGLNEFATRQMSNLLNVDMGKVFVHDNSHLGMTDRNAYYSTSVSSFASSNDGKSHVAGNFTSD